MTQVVSILTIIICSIFIDKVHNLPPWFDVVTPKHSLPEFYKYFCNNNSDLVVTYDTSVPIKYYVWINEFLEDGTEITVRFDSEPTVNLITTYFDNLADLKLKSEPDLIENIYTFDVKNASKTNARALFYVQGERPPHHPPYITSFKVNGEERCIEPVLGFFGEGGVAVTEYYRDAPDKLCGRRKLSTQKEPKPLIVSGSSTRPGWWPWHAALFKNHNGGLNYFGGGTLISKRVILTAAHCVTVNGEPANPDLFKVALGKFHLFKDEETTQLIKVNNIIVHDNYTHRRLDNDIALLKLKKDAHFNNYVQPACLWFDGIYDQIATYSITGVVVGWGFDKTDNVTNTLQLATMPHVPDPTCILYQPIFYSHVLNRKKFCAGSQYGSRSGTPCNGDSGGGYVVLVSDEPRRDEPLNLRPLIDAGAWYVKGIVSMTLSREDTNVCDPHGYTVFTDVAQYRDWILNYLELNN